jgi:hypothetical protein
VEARDAALPSPGDEIALEVRAGGLHVIPAPAALPSAT